MVSRGHTASPADGQLVSGQRKLHRKGKARVPLRSQDSPQAQAWGEAGIARRVREASPLSSHAPSPEGPPGARGKEALGYDQRG